MSKLHLLLDAATWAFLIATWVLLYKAWRLGQRAQARLEEQRKAVLKWH